MLAVAMAAEAAGQAKIMTKKFRLSDFTDRVTKVVLSGNEMMDSALKMEVSERWTVSPFEFCTAGEFAALKQSDRYYFLLVTMQDPAMRFLTLVNHPAGKNIVRYPALRDSSLLKEAEASGLALAQRA